MATPHQPMNKVGKTPSHFIQAIALGLKSHSQKRGFFMYHCHILKHEDNGMMGQVLV
uniref:multicopper oxidase domain-containing protein n=1 Tax=Streptococcus macedonicus TaxID=59310 RepID=UPI003908A8A9